MSARGESVPCHPRGDPAQGVTISTGSCVVSRVAYSAWFVLPPEMRKVNEPLPVIAEVTSTSTQVPVVVTPSFARRGELPIGGALFQVMRALGPAVADLVDAAPGRARVRDPEPKLGGARRSRSGR